MGAPQGTLHEEKASLFSLKMQGTLLLPFIFSPEI